MLFSQVAAQLSTQLEIREIIRKLSQYNEYQDEFTNASLLRI